MTINREIEKRIWELLFVEGMTHPILLRMLQEEFSISLYAARSFFSEVVKRYPAKIEDAPLANEDKSTEHNFVLMKYNVEKTFLKSSTFDSFHDAAVELRKWLEPIFIPHTGKYEPCHATLLKTDKLGHIIKFVFSTMKED